MIRMALIDEGKKAPAFTLTDQDGKAHRLSDYAGRPVILYFYPKDDTPGCTKESCEFRDNLPKFRKSKAAVFGVSIQEPNASWGNMIYSQLSNLNSAPTVWVVPSVLIFVSVLALNYLGDVVRARFDVRESAL